MIENNVDLRGPIKMGKNVTIRSFAVIYEDVVIGDNVIIGHGSIIRPGSIIEDNVYIGNLNQIQGNCIIGEYTRFPTNVHITKESIIGKRCFIAPGFVSTNTLHPLCPVNEKCTKGVILEDDVKIGANVTTAPGIKIGRNSLIGVGSVITRDVEPHSFMFGNPAKKIKDVRDITCPFNYISYPYPREDE